MSDANANPVPETRRGNRLRVADSTSRGDGGKPARFIRSAITATKTRKKRPCGRTSASRPGIRERRCEECGAFAPRRNRMHAPEESGMTDGVGKRHLSSATGGGTRRGAAAFQLAPTADVVGYKPGVLRRAR